MSIEKTDHRDVTRPGHTLTYTITVKNTGDTGTLGDVVVTDVVPSALEILSVSNDGHVEGQRVTWGEFALSEGESLAFTILAQVKDGTSNGHVLTNTVKARSDDEGLAANDIDTTVVESIGKIAASETTAPLPVPITAATGTSGFLGALASLILGPLGWIASAIL